MKKRDLFLPIVAASAISVAASQAALVSVWSLDDTSSGVAIDSIGGNTATWQNGTNTNLANAAGQIGGAADLSDLGGNNYFQMTIPQLIGASGISFSAWINNDANAGYTGIFMTRTFNGQTNNSWGLAIEPGGASWRFDARVDGPGIDSADDSVPVDGTWKHLALVWDSTTETFTSYLNGVVANTGTTSTDPNFGGPTIAGPVSGPWYIGYDDCCGGGRDFDGRIDDIGVWDNALTAAQVNRIYQNGLAGISVPEPSVSLFGLLASLLLLRRRR